MAAQSSRVAAYILTAPLCTVRLFCLLIKAAFFAAFGFASSATAQGLFDATSLIDIHVGSPRSDAVSHLRNGGYELADGTAVNFDHWYSSRWRDLSFVFLTQIGPNFGLIWGGSTGEHGEKYHIAPALKIGFMQQISLSQSSVLTVSASTKLGGLLQEKTCSADYGDIGGIQQVNCRLAASTMRPADTLDYLLYVPAKHEAEISLTYELRF